MCQHHHVFRHTSLWSNAEAREACTSVNTKLMPASAARTSAERSLLRTKTLCSSLLCRLSLPKLVASGKDARTIA